MDRVYCIVALDSMDSLDVHVVKLLLLNKLLFMVRKVFSWLAVLAPRSKYFVEQAVIFALLSVIFHTGTENYAGFSFHSPSLPILPRNSFQVSQSRTARLVQIKVL